MNSLFVGLPKAYDQDAVVRVVAVLRKALVGCNHRALLLLGQRPQFIIQQALVGRPANVEDVVPRGDEGVE